MTHYIVETYTLCDGWINCWSIIEDDDSETPQTFIWAEYALVAFESQTGSERDVALGDLLCDLMHWADRNNQDFEAAHARATGHYRIETGLDEDA